MKNKTGSETLTWKHLNIINPVWTQQLMSQNKKLISINEMFLRLSDDNTSSWPEPSCTWTNVQTAEMKQQINYFHVRRSHVNQIIVFPLKEAELEDTGWFDYDQEINSEKNRKTLLGQIIIILLEIISESDWKELIWTHLRFSMFTMMKGQSLTVILTVVLSVTFLETFIILDVLFFV